MVSIYNKRPKPQYSMPGIALQTTSAETNLGKAASEILGKKADEYAKKAQENFNLGKQELINTLLNDAYKTAPDNVQEFDEIVNDNLSKSIQGLPENMQENIIASVRAKKSLYDVKVFENRKKSIDNERTNLVLGNIQHEDKAILASQESMYQSLVDKDKEVFNVAKKSYNSSLSNMKAYTEATNMKGNYILNDKAARELRQTGQFGHMDSFANTIDQLSLNDLKEFDKTTFQDKKSYMENIGVDRTTYDSQEKYLKNRLKSLGDEETRVINDQAYFNASKQIVGVNPDELKQLEKNDIVSSKFIKLIREAQEIEPNPIFVQETTDEGFISAIRQLNTVLENKTGYTGEEYRSQLLEVGAEAGKEITAMANKLGITEEDQAKFKNAIADVMQDKDGTVDRIIRPYVYDDNATAFILKSPIPAISRFLDTTRETLGRAYEAGVNRRTGKTSSVFTERGVKYTKNESLIKQAKLMAQEGFKMALDFSAVGNNEEAETIFQDVNKRIIRKLNSTILPEEELERLERAKAAGVNAITEINGQYYDFEGYDNFQPIFRRR